MAGWIFYPDRQAFLRISNEAVLLSYPSCVHWSSTFNFKNFSFAFATWLAGSSLWPLSAFNRSSTLCVTISAADLKGETCHSSFHLEATIGVLVGLTSGNWNYCCVSGNREAWERARDGGTASLWSSQNTHVYWLSLLSHMGAVHGAPKTVIIVTSKSADHRSPSKIE